MQHGQMKIQVAAILISVLIAALSLDLGSDFDLVLIHLVFPMFWGAIISLWWSQVAWRLRVLGVFAVVVVCQALRIVVHGMELGWAYVTDTVTQYLMLYSVVAQLVVAFLALAAIGAARKRRIQRHVG